MVGKDGRPLVVDFNVSPPFRTSGYGKQLAAVGGIPGVNGAKVPNPNALRFPAAAGRAAFEDEPRPLPGRDRS
jgi:hypothetical protein